MAKTVLLLIRSLDIGGAQRQLVALAEGLHSRGVGVAVASFYSGGALLTNLRTAGIPVIDLAKRKRWDVFAFFWRFVTRTRVQRPSVLYCFLPMANLLGILVRPFAGRMRVVWGVRASNMDLEHYDGLAKVEAFLAARTARFADAIVCNSSAGLEYHARKGYPRDKMYVIPNGIDTDLFRFDSVGRAKLRHEWGVGEDETLIGLVARLDPMKDHETFLLAASMLAPINPRLRFACIGEGTDQYARNLRWQASAGGLDRRVIWVGERTDMPAVYSALDIVSSSSRGEGFSNAIAEAMACERTCVVTDVGDSAWIVGGTGRVVPPRSSDALAAAWHELTALPMSERRMLGKAARQRVEDMFSVTRMVDATGAILGLWAN